MCAIRSVNASADSAGSKCVPLDLSTLPQIHILHHKSCVPIIWIFIYAILKALRSRGCLKSCNLLLSCHS